MNTLTWFLYFASIPDKIIGLNFLFGFGLIAATISSLISYVYWDRYPTEPQKEITLKLLILTKRLVIAFFIILTFWFIFPPERTMYYMAASELGEKVVTDPQAIEILGDLKTIIKGYAQEYRDTFKK